MKDIALPMGFDPIAFVQNAKVSAQKLLFLAYIKIASCLGALVVMGGAWLLEVVLAYTVIEANFGPEFPGDPVPLKVYVLSFASICAILGFHALMLQHPDHPIANFLRKLARIALLVFFIGMALLFLTTDLTAPPAELAADDLFEQDQSLGAWMWSFIEPFVALTSALALGGLVFINLSLSDAILSYVQKTLPISLNQRREARAILTDANALQEMNPLYGDLERQQDELSTVSEDNLALEAAGKMSDAAHPTIQAMREMQLEAGLNPPATHSPLDKRGDARLALAPDEIDHFLAEYDEFIDNLPAQLRDL